MSDPVRIGFAGVGSMGQCAHLRNYATIEECEVVAISELRPKLRERVAAKYGVARTYESAAEMIEAESLEGIVASQPFNHHGRLLPPLYAAGIPLFTEKPLAASVEVGQQLIGELKKTDSWHMVGYHKRSDPATMLVIEEIRRAKESGDLGAMKYIRITMPAGDWIAGGFVGMVSTDEQVPPADADPPASDLDEASFGLYVNLVNFYVHQVNLMRYLLGEDYKVTHADSSGVLLVSESDSGIPGVLEMTPFSTSLDWQEVALVCFEKGWFKLTFPAPVAVGRHAELEIFREGGAGGRPETVIPQLPWVSAMRQQAVNFCAAIRGEIEPPCEAEDAMKDLHVLRDYIRLRKGV